MEDAPRKPADPQLVVGALAGLLASALNEPGCFDQYRAAFGAPFQWAAEKFGGTGVELLGEYVALLTTQVEEMRRDIELGERNGI